MDVNSFWRAFCLLIVCNMLVLILQSAVLSESKGNNQERDDMKLVDGEFDRVSEVMTKIDCANSSSYALSFLSEEAILHRTGNCDSYHRTMDFFGQEISDARLSLISESPLAFSHSINGHAGILEVFLSLTFRPGDSHCIHIDAKASDLTTNAVEAIISCYNQKYPGTTIFAIPHPVPVYWGHFSVLKASSYMTGQDTTRKLCDLIGSLIHIYPSLHFTY